MGKKILVLTEMAFKGSGYYYLMSPMLEGLSKMGYDVKVVGLSYDGSEHNYTFSIVPAVNLQDSVPICNAIIQIWKPDIFICGLDIPLQIVVHEQIRQFGIKYIAITPLENPPLTASWAARLMSMDHVFFISELGNKSARQAGMSKVSHIQVGVDSGSLRPPTEEERVRLREGLDIKDGEFVILTVADNQERKNLWAGLMVLCLLSHPDLDYITLRCILTGKSDKKVSDFRNTNNKRLILVTRKDSQVGWRIDDLSLDLDIYRNILTIERGISREDLWKMYAAADIYLSTSKAEGLGLPVLEAMACGLPVFANSTGALTELLEDHRGYLMPNEYEFIDPWGNEWREMIDMPSTVSAIMSYMQTGDMFGCKEKARKYIEGRTFDIPTKQLSDKIEELLNEKETN